jgi:hypothetical protein
VLSLTESLEFLPALRVPPCFASSSLLCKFLLPCGNCSEINANSRSGMMQAQGVELDAAWVDCNEKVSKMRTHWCC